MSNLTKMIKSCTKSSSNCSLGQYLCNIIELDLFTSLYFEGNEIIAIFIILILRTNKIDAFMSQEEFLEMISSGITEGSQAPHNKVPHLGKILQGLLDKSRV